MYILVKILKALHSDAGPWSLAFAVTLGMMMGLTPLDRLHNLVLLLIVLLFRVNLGLFLLSFGVFSILAFALDPVMIKMGQAVLTQSSLQEIWQAFYQTGIGRLSQFNHTLTMGSLCLSLILAPLVLALSRFVVVRYREHLMKRLDKLHIVQFLKGTQAFQIFQSMRN